jgi:hypothetical protein
MYHVIENSSFCTAYKSSVSTCIAKQIMPTLRIASASHKYGWFSLYSLGKDTVENAASNSSTVACAFIAAEMFLPRRCPALTVSYGSTVLVFRRHVTFLPPYSCSSRVAYRRTAISSSPREGAYDVYYCPSEWYRNVILISTLLV